MKKYIVMLLFSILVIFLTFYSLYDHDSFQIMLDNITNIPAYYILILLLVLFVYFLLQSLYTKIVLKSLKQKITMKKAFFYSFVEFYFSGITPSSTGGQPVQFYYMTKDKIPIRRTYITLLLNTIYFKLIILVLGIIVLIFNNKYIFSSSIIYSTFFMIGLIVDIIIVFLGFLLLFKQNVVQKMFRGVKKFGSKIPVFKNRLERVNIEDTLSKYKDEVKYMKNNKGQVALTFFITLVQRLILFSTAYIVYRALGFNDCSYIEMLVIQITLQVTIEAFPLPGGTGISEHMLHDIFRGLYGVLMADAAMVLTRMFTFYIPLIFSGIVILIYSIKNKIVKNK